MVRIYGRFKNKKEAEEFLSKIKSSVWNLIEDKHVEVYKTNGEGGSKWGFCVEAFIDSSNAIFQQSLFQVPGIEVKSV